MKIMSILAAGLIAATGLAAAPASAQERTVVRERVTPGGRTVVRERTTTVRRYGYNRPRRVCTVRYRHGERIRTCRFARY